MVPSSVPMNTWKSNESMLIFCSLFKQPLLSTEHRIIDLIALISTITRFVTPIHAAWWNINFFSPRCSQTNGIALMTRRREIAQIFSKLILCGKKRNERKKSKIREKNWWKAFFFKERPRAHCSGRVYIRSVLSWSKNPCSNNTTPALL